MKSIIKTTVLASLAFAVCMTLIIGPGDNNYSILFVFLFSFFGFGILIFLFSFFMFKKNEKIAKEFGEEVYYHGLANRIVGAESVGGHIFVVKDKIIFKSHSLNVQNSNEEILLKDILEVKKYNTLGIVPNGLEIVQKEKTDIFIVNKRSKALDVLNTLIVQKN